MIYIADKIKEDYRTWKLEPEDLGKPDTIFISAPTGSGKTTFVFDVFLPYLAKRKKRLLYLVNRAILKKQLEERICSLPYEQKSIIDVKLYQTIETECSSQYGGYYYQQYSQKYDCVVCDEAHYFLADSNYNTNTIISYNFVRDIFRGKLRIYMSATIKEIYEIVERDNEESIYERTGWFGFHNNKLSRFGWMNKCKSVMYEIERNYDYVKIDLLKEIEEIKEIVEKIKEKWLIFVESKNMGLKLGSEIENSIFIKSSYKKEKESRDEVEEIVRKDKSSVRVLIATSVLDNGIDLKDIELRNIIIMSDIETEFVQMLGRKRKDGKPCNLYLFKQKEDHFRRRYEENRKKLEIAEKGYKYAEGKICSLIKNDDLVSSDKLQKCEDQAIVNIHKYWGLESMKNSEVYENIKASFLYLNGILCLNMLAFKNLENLSQYYTRIIKDFELYGKNAFLREQLRWLGKSDQEIENLVKELNFTLTEKSRQNVIKKLKKNVDIEMTEKEVKKLKIEIRDDLKVLIESVDDNKDDKNKFTDNCSRTDRPISKPLMEFLAKFCKIPYKLSVKDGIYTFENLKE